MREVERYAEPVIGGMLADQDRWILILECPGPPVRYVQVPAPRKAIREAVTEAVSDHFL